MASVLIFLILLIIASAATWFYFPAAKDVVNLERENARIRAITRQTQRDMDGFARREHRDGW